MRKFWLIGFLVGLIASLAAGQQMPTPPSIIQAYQFQQVPNVPPQVNTSFVVTSSSQTGSATYWYWIVTNQSGVYSQPAGAFPAYNAPAALSSSASVTINWSALGGGYTYDVLRTATSAMPSGACNCAVATGLTKTTATDTGTLSAYSVNGDWIPTPIFGQGNAQLFVMTNLATTLSSCPSLGCVVYDAVPETWNSNPFSSLPSGVTAEVHLLRGTWTTNVSIVVPNKCQLLGSGRGDVNANGTAIQAGSSFPSSTAVIQFGSSAPSFGVRVQNMLIDCQNKSGAIGVQNQNAQEQSGLDFVTIHNCPASELSISGSGAQNSGPYRNLEIYNDSSCTNCSAATVPVNVGTGISALRAIEDVTINDNGTATNPNVALEWDAGNGGQIQNLHVEYAGVGVQVGANGAVTGLSIANIECGPSPTVPKCINISAANSVQAYTIQNVFTASGTLLTDNQYSGPFTSGSDSGLSLYAVGVGAIASRPRFYQSDSGIASLLGSTAMVGGLNMNGNAITDGSTGAGPTIAGAQLSAHLNQSATGNLAGTCAFSSSTTCTKTYGTAFNSTPILLFTPVNPGTTTFTLTSSSASGFTLTASASNSLTVNWVAIGNPN